MRCNIEGKEYVFPVELPDYEEACEELLDRIRQPVKRSLKDAHIRLSDIDQVVLVGGATKSPVIRRFAGKLFHMIPDTKINPDEAVALGSSDPGGDERAPGRHPGSDPDRRLSPLPWVRK